MCETYAVKKHLNNIAEIFAPSATKLPRTNSLYGIKLVDYAPMRLVLFIKKTHGLMTVLVLEK